MVEVPGSVAYLTFTDLEDCIRAEEIETAAVRRWKKSPKDLSESDIIDLRTALRGCVARGRGNCCASV